MHTHRKGVVFGTASSLIYNVDDKDRGIRITRLLYQTYSRKALASHSPLICVHRTGIPIVLA